MTKNVFYCMLDERLHKIIWEAFLPVAWGGRDLHVLLWRRRGLDRLPGSRNPEQGGAGSGSS